MEEPPGASRQFRSKTRSTGRGLRPDTESRDDRRPVSTNAPLHLRLCTLRCPAAAAHPGTTPARVPEGLGVSIRAADRPTVDRLETGCVGCRRNHRGTRYRGSSRIRASRVQVRPAVRSKVGRNDTRRTYRRLPTRTWPGARDSHRSLPTVRSGKQREVVQAQIEVGEALVIVDVDACQHAAPIVAEARSVSASASGTVGGGKPLRAGAVDSGSVARRRARRRAFAFGAAGTRECAEHEGGP